MNPDLRFRIGKTYISVTNPDDAVARIERAVKEGIKGYVCVSNMRMVRYANKTIEYRKVMEDSLMNVPDGMPLAWMGRLWGKKNVKCTKGFTLFNTILQNRNECRHFLLGDTEETLKKLSDKCKSEYHANVVGVYSPPFKEVEEFDYNNIAEIINKSNADVIWIAMRSPKQDFFSNKLMPYLKRGICIGVGRAFRFVIGEFKMPDGVINKMGMTGLVSRRTSLFDTLGWYACSCFFLLYYCVQIIVRRIIGCKPSE